VVRGIHQVIDGVAIRGWTNTGFYARTVRTKPFTTGICAARCSRQRDSHAGLHAGHHGTQTVRATLKESEERFRSFADNITNLAWIADGEGWIYWYNQRWYHYTGTTLDEMQGWGWEKVHHPDYIERVMAFVKKPGSVMNLGN
jgi:PAS domain-containing protein